MINGKIKKIQAYQKDNAWYLNAVVEIENEEGLRKITIPKIYLVNSDLTHVDVMISREGYRYSYENMFIHIDECNGTDGCFKALPIDKIKYKDKTGKTTEVTNAIYIDEIIKEKTRKMTVEDIEKKLGYKIEIVSGKEE